jgi:hypothetical protein
MDAEKILEQVFKIFRDEYEDLLRRQKNVTLKQSELVDSISRLGNKIMTLEEAWYAHKKNNKSEEYGLPSSVMDEIYAKLKKDCESHENKPSTDLFKLSD